MTSSSHPAPKSPLTSDALLRMTDHELSTSVRVRHVALLLVSLLAGVALVSLWVTEPSLPARTHVAFALLTLICLSWTAFAARVLAVRRVLYAGHRVVAGRMAVAFTGVFVAGALTNALATGATAGYIAAGTGVVLLAVAIALLTRSRRALARLKARRAELASNA